MSCVVGSLNDDRSAISFGWDIISSFVYQLSRKSNPVLGISDSVFRSAILNSSKGLTTSSSVSLEVLLGGSSLLFLGIYSDWVILEAVGGGGGGAVVGLNTIGGGGGGAPEGFIIDATGGGGFEDEAKEVIELLTAEVVDDKVDTGDDEEKD